MVPQSQSRWANTIMSTQLVIIAKRKIDISINKIVSQYYLLLLYI